MKKLIAVFLLVLLVANTYAQKAKVTSNLNFMGSIGSYPIEMSLKFTNYADSVSGSYYYRKSGKDNYIYLDGKLKNGILTLQESTYNVKKKKFEETGFFKMDYITKTKLSGSWQKNKNANPEKYMSVKLSSREKLADFNPLGYDFIMSKRKADYENITENAARYFTLHSININVNRHSKWVLSDFDQYDLVLNEVELEDVNFDGYLDIKVPVYYPDMAKNDYGYRYFLYDVKSKGFKKNSRLNELDVLFINPVGKELEKTDADGSGNEGTQYYKWQNGKLYLTKEIRVYENDEYIHYTEYKIENDQSVKVKSYKKKE